MDMLWSGQQGRWSSTSEGQLGLARPKKKVQKGPSLEGDGLAS